jgi:superfamily II DNA or RNA helicase
MFAPTDPGYLPEPRSFKNEARSLLNSVKQLNQTYAPGKYKVKDGRQQLEFFLHTGIYEPLHKRVENNRKNLRGSQVNVVRKIKNVRRFLVYHGTGTGKTLIAAHVTKDYLDGKPKHIVICVTPIVKQYANEVLKVVPDGSHVFFLTYTGLENLDKTLFTDAVLKNTMFIFDEVHNLIKKNLGNLEQAHKIILLTATPVVNELKNLVSYARLMHTSMNVGVGNASSTEPNVRIFNNRVSVNVNKDPSNARFPKLDGPHDIRVNINQRIMSSLKSTKYKSVTSVYTAQNKLFKNMGLSHNPKYDKFKSIFDSSSGDQRSIVYFENVSTAKDFEKHLKGVYGQEFKVEMITGETANSARRNLIRNNSVKVYIITEAGATGLDFTNITNIVFMEFPLTYCAYQQIVGRGIRVLPGPLITNNSKRPVVHVYNLFITDDEKNALTPNAHRKCILNAKKNTTEKVKSALSMISIQRARPRVNARNNAPNSNYTFGYSKQLNLRVGRSNQPVFKKTGNNRPYIFKNGRPYVQPSPLTPKPPPPPRTPKQTFTLKSKKGNGGAGSSQTNPNNRNNNSFFGPNE